MKQFHVFRLDTVNHCLWRGEERVLLAPKAFDVLRYLVEHADRLVTQEEILNALWPETYVNPEVIKKYILGIRKALGDPRDERDAHSSGRRFGARHVRYRAIPRTNRIPAPSSRAYQQKPTRVEGSRHWVVGQFEIYGQLGGL